MKLAMVRFAAVLALAAPAVFAQPSETASPPASKPPEAKQPAEGKPPEAKPGEQQPIQEKHVYVKMTTSMGEVFLELDNEKAPISTANFMSYVEDGFYDGTIFHRVIKNFMVQGGGFTADMKQKPTKKAIKNEWKNGLKNKRGTIAMARTSVADSATSQFFINVVDNDALDQPRDGAAYAVFGKVVAGMATVDKIRDVKTGRKDGHADVPVETVTITKVVKIEKSEADLAVENEKKSEKK